ncbi:MAG: OmpA family protein [Mariprofundaceae bacterium]|nr:OmpA family protein [Mariprofundaceae bacterium]
MKYLYLCLGMTFFISGCATLNQESYDTLMSLPPKVDTLKQKVAQLEGEKKATKISAKINLDPKPKIIKKDVDTSVETIEALTKEMQDEINNHAVTVRETAPRVIQITMQQHVLFASGSASVNRQGKAFLQKFLRVAKNLPQDAHIRIVGHSDNRQLSWEKRKRFKNNQGLSEARADAVKSILSKEPSLPANMLHAEGRGASEPIGNNGTTAGRALNRRIDIFVENI